jgi:hypothetical protein
MKTTIDANGTLRVKAETPLEAYALKKWSEENLCATAPESPDMIIDLNVEVKE